MKETKDKIDRGLGRGSSSLKKDLLDKLGLEESIVNGLEESIVISRLSG